MKQIEEVKLAIGSKIISIMGDLKKNNLTQICKHCKEQGYRLLLPVKIKDKPKAKICRWCGKIQ